MLSEKTGFHRDYTPGTAYGAYFFSDELMFPASVKDDSLKQKEKVFGLRISGANKAWPLKLFKQPTVINDQIGIIPIVLIGDAKSETVRAYRSESMQFQLSKKRPTHRQQPNLATHRKRTYRPKQSKTLPPPRPCSLLVCMEWLLSRNVSRTSKINTIID